MNRVLQETYTANQKALDGFILNFKSTGEKFGNQNRNTLKLFQLEGKTINVKSFKIPNVLNKIIYRFFRKSKAQRSYEYANKLMEMGIGTPQPIAYYEFETPFFFMSSFYVSEQIETEYTYRDLLVDFSIPNYEDILRAFTRFTFELHEKNIHFLDHSPGNTLIKILDDGYAFYLVDLNRMKFEAMDFETRIKNFSRLTVHKSMVKIMSDEYAKCSGESFHDIFELMWRYTERFQRKFHRRRRLKNKFLFRRNHI